MFYENWNKRTMNTVLYPWHRFFFNKGFLKFNQGENLKKKSKILHNLEHKNQYWYLRSHWVLKSLCCLSIDWKWKRCQNLVVTTNMYNDLSTKQHIKWSVNKVPLYFNIWTYYLIFLGVRYVCHSTYWQLRLHGSFPCY